MPRLSLIKNKNHKTKVDFSLDTPIATQTVYEITKDTGFLKDYFTLQDNKKKPSPTPLFVKNELHKSNDKQNVDLNTKIAKSNAKTSDISNDNNSKEVVRNVKNIIPTQQDTPIISSDISSDIPNQSNDVKNQVMTQINKSDDKVMTKPMTKLVTKVMTDVIPKKAFSELSPLSRKILLILFTSCQKQLDRSTEKLSVSYIAEHVTSSVSSVKRTIYRLIDNYIINKTEYKDGRGGWTRYSLNFNIYNQILLFKCDDRCDDRCDDKVMTIGLKPISSSSSDIYNNKINTTTKKDLLTHEGTQTIPLPNSTPEMMSEQWQTIDITPLTNIGFTVNHLTQIYLQNTLTPEQVQESIYGLAHDIEVNNKQFKTRPLNFIMGILKSGRPYLPSDNYEDPKIRDLRIFNERLKQRKEKENQLKEETLGLVFDEWYQTQTKEERVGYIPANMKQFASNNEKVTRSFAKEHFKKEVVPNREDLKVLHNYVQQEHK